MPEGLRETFHRTFLLKPGRNPLMEARERELLARLYRDDVLALQEILGRDLSMWLKNWQTKA